MEYRGIELDVSGKSAVLGASMIQRNHNADWIGKLAEIPWKNLKEPFKENYDAVCRFFSLYQMNYQIRNGGIAQYFDNGYHEGKDPHHENDIELYDLEEQKKDFGVLVAFADQIFPERKADNEALKMVMTDFQKLWLEEDVEVSKYVECWEDHYLYDSETNEEYENPEWFEGFENYRDEDIIRGLPGDKNGNYPLGSLDDLEFQDLEKLQDRFNENYFKSAGYLGELLELQAQYCCKSFVKEFVKQADRFPEEKEYMQDIFGDLMGLKGKTLQELIDEAKKSGAMQKEKEEKTIVKKNERSL